MHAWLDLSIYLSILISPSEVPFNMDAAFTFIRYERKNADETNLFANDQEKLMSNESYHNKKDASIRNVELNMKIMMSNVDSFASIVGSIFTQIFSLL